MSENAVIGYVVVVWHSDGTLAGQWDGELHPDTLGAGMAAAEAIANGYQARVGTVTVATEYLPDATD